MNCEQIEEMAGAYALGALDAAERRAFDEHLAGCDEHGELASLRATAMLLERSVEEHEPPEGMRSRVLAAAIAARAADDAVEPMHAPSAVPIPIRRPEPPRWMRWGSLAAAIVIGSLAGLLLVRSLQPPPPALLVGAVQQGPGVGTQLHYAPDRRLVILEVAGLGSLPEGREYQVWAIHAHDAPRGVGLFVTKPDGTITLEMEMPLEPGDTIAVTVEPRGGSPAPTSTPLFAITF